MENSHPDHLFYKCQQFIPLGQIILFDQKEYLLLDKPNFFMDNPITCLGMHGSWLLP
jgi:hypothetical protein